VNVEKDGTTYRVSWDAAELKDNVPVRYYCVYASTNEEVDIDDIKNCVGFAVKDMQFTYSSDKALNFVVTAFDMNYYESDPAKNTSGINDANAECAKVVANDRSIYVHGVKEGTKVSVYSANGEQMYTGTDTQISINSRGLYIVKVIDKVFKVVL
jgi:hypothetical protein